MLQRICQPVALAARQATAITRGIGALLLLGCATPVESNAQAATSDTLTIEQVVAAVRSANPTVAAASLRADVTAERVSPAGALPDPMLAFGLMNRTIDGFSASEPMSMNTVQLTQRFPWPGKLSFGQERLRYLAEADALEAAETELTLISRAKSLYYRLAFVDRSIAIMRETRDLLRNFHRVTSAMYAVGTGLQQDVLQAQVAIAQMTENITVMEQNRQAMAARLNALMGEEATEAVGGLELPRVAGRLPPADSLLEAALAGRPALRAQDERARAAEAGYRAARRALYPDFTVTLGYAQRPEFRDLATVMIGISLPLWAGGKQLPLRREMQAMQSVEEAKARDLYNETYARLVELRAEAERAAKLVELYATAVLPQSRAAVESALSAYRVGRVDYTTLVQHQMTVNRYAIETVRLTADYHRAVADIEALVGGDFGGAQ